MTPARSDTLRHYTRLAEEARMIQPTAWNRYKDWLFEALCNGTIAATAMLGVAAGIGVTVLLIAPILAGRV